MVSDGEEGPVIRHLRHDRQFSYFRSVVVDLGRRDAGLDLETRYPWQSNRGLIGSPPTKKDVRFRLPHFTIYVRNETGVFKLLSAGDNCQQGRHAFKFFPQLDMPFHFFLDLVHRLRDQTVLYCIVLYMQQGI